MTKSGHSEIPTVSVLDVLGHVATNDLDTGRVAVRAHGTAWKKTRVRILTHVIHTKNFTWLSRAYAK